MSIIKKRISKKTNAESQKETPIKLMQFKAYLDHLGIDYNITSKNNFFFSATVKKPATLRNFLEIFDIDRERCSVKLKFSDIYNSKITKGFFEN
mgnify:CR=1 FL=1